MLMPINHRICITLLLLSLCAVAPALATGLDDLRPGYWSAIQPPPENLGGESFEEISVTIIDINRQRNLVTYQYKDGVTKTIVADDLDTLSQIQPGDRADVTLYKGSAIVIIHPDDMPDVEARDSELRSLASDGSPIVSSGTGVGVKVKINSVDPYKKTITYSLPGQQPKEISMNSPRMLPYLEKLKDGDTVEMLFIEARAAKIVPKGK